MICGSCHGTGHLVRRWRKGPRPVCGGCNGRGRIRESKSRRRVSATAPKNFVEVRTHTITAAAFEAAIAKLREADAKNRTFCPKCGKRTFEMEMRNPEGAARLAELGYDGTCCWPGWDELARKNFTT